MAKVTFANKKNFIDDTSVPNEEKITAENINELKKVLNDLIDDCTTITQLTVPPSTYKIPTSTYTKLRFTKSEQIGQGTTKLVHLNNNVAYLQIRGVYRITVDHLWFNTLSSNTGSVQIRIGSNLKTSTLVSSSSSLGAQIYSACGIVTSNAGVEIPVEIFQSTGSDVTIKAIDAKVELLSRL